MGPITTVEQQHRIFLSHKHSGEEGIMISVVHIYKINVLSETPRVIDMQALFFC